MTYTLTILCITLAILSSIQIASSQEGVEIQESIYIPSYIPTYYPSPSDSLSSSVSIASVGLGLGGMLVSGAAVAAIYLRCRKHQVSAADNFSTVQTSVSNDNDDDDDDGNNGNHDNHDKHEIFTRYCATGNTAMQV